MTQDDNERREDIRHKTANAIGLIDEAMAARHKLPNDEHDLHAIENIARLAGEEMVRRMDEPDFNPLTILMDEMRKADPDDHKTLAETNIAMSAMARAFGISDEFNDALGDESRQAHVQSALARRTPKPGQSNQR